MRTDPLLKFETIFGFKLNCPSNARHGLILESKTNNSSHLCDTTLAFSQMTPAPRSNPEASCRSEVPSRPRLVTHPAARHWRTVWARAWGVKGLARNWMPRPDEAPRSA